MGLVRVLADSYPVTLGGAGVGSDGGPDGGLAVPMFPAPGGGELPRWRIGTDAGEGALIGCNCEPPRRLVVGITGKGPIGGGEIPGAGSGTSSGIPGWSSGKISGEVGPSPLELLVM